MPKTKVTISAAKPMKITKTPKQPTGTDHFQFLCHQVAGFEALGSGGGFCIAILFSAFLVRVLESLEQGSIDDGSIIFGLKRGQFELSADNRPCQIAPICGFLPAKSAGSEAGIIQFEKPLRREGRCSCAQAVISCIGRSEVNLLLQDNVYQAGKSRWSRPKYRWLKHLQDTGYIRIPFT